MFRGGRWGRDGAPAGAHDNGPAEQNVHLSLPTNNTAAAAAAAAESPARARARARSGGG